MHTALPLSGPRVRLRHWRDDDLPAFAALNADPQVMAHFPAPLSRSDSDALAARLRAGLAERGWGAWVLARRDDDALLGCVGLNPVAASFPFAPAVEMLWRLARPAWGQGLAHEGAQLALAAARDAVVARMGTPSREVALATGTRLQYSGQPAGQYAPYYTDGTEFPGPRTVRVRAPGTREIPDSRFAAWG